jgi:uncharacterized protein (TIGR02453 family)
MRYFEPALFKFLNDLAANNDRDWFNANKDRYIDSVQEPALTFIADFAPRLEKISPHFLADAKVQGGSLFRIYRDTRFGTDKTPYKSNTGVHFRHERSKDAHAPGYYLHLQPGECFMGVGLWRPEAKVASRIRENIAENPVNWKKAAHDRRFTDVYRLEGDSLKRPPKGFDPDHPLIEDLKRKDFIASTRLTQKQVTGSGFMDLFEDHCKRATPFMAFLCDALRVEF